MLIATKICGAIYYRNVVSQWLRKSLPKKPKYGEILITALVDLIVGALLILVDKAIK